MLGTVYMQSSEIDIHFWHNGIQYLHVNLAFRSFPIHRNIHGRVYCIAQNFLSLCSSIILFPRPRAFAIPQ